MYAGLLWIRSTISTHYLVGLSLTKKKKKRKNQGFALFIHKLNKLKIYLILDEFLPISCTSLSIARHSSWYRPACTKISAGAARRHEQAPLAQAQVAPPLHVADDVELAVDVGDPVVLGELPPRSSTYSRAACINRPRLEFFKVFEVLYTKWK